MQSNSKLNKVEKSLLKDFAKFMPQVKFAHMGKTTVAFAHVGNLVEFSTAICSDNEKKNRPKVGKYWAMTRFENGETVKMPFAQFDNMVESAFWD
jgi:hypothetical protein